MGEQPLRCPVVISARGEAITLPGLSLGSWRSRGTQSVYCKGPLLFQGATTAGSAVPAHGLWAKIPTAALEPALLSGSGMPAAAPTLAGGAATGPATAGRCRPSRARRGGTCAPSACPSSASSSEARSCGSAWSRSKNFLPIPCARGRGAMNRLRRWAAIRHTTVARIAAGRSTGCGIANASGFGVVLSRAAANASRNIKLPARGVVEHKHPQRIPPQRHHERRRRRDRTDRRAVRGR